MKTKFNGFLTLLLALVVQISFAQQKTVSGTVSDSSGSLPGVSVTVKGTSKGVETDFDGKYSIKVKNGDVLVFRYLGFTQLQRTVGTSNTINVEMIVDENNVLDEVVVIGYGTTTKRSFTGTASVVTPENINAKSVSNVAQALIGEASGVSVVRANGRPGASADIRIRGFSSIEGNSAPLYVVDGVPLTTRTIDPDGDEVDSGIMNSINPNDIASLTILKDASATAIYGARGANGVVLITTKRGKSGKSTIEFDFQTSINSRVIPFYDLVNGEEEYMGLVYDGLKNSAELNGNANPSQFALDNIFSDRGVAPLYNMWNVADGNELINPATGQVRDGVTRKFTPGNWAKETYRDGIRNEMNFKISGGDDKTTHYFSVGYLSDEGYVQESNFDRYSARLNVTTKPIDRVKINTNLDYSYSEFNDATGYGGGVVTYMADFIPTIYSILLRDADGNVVSDPNTGNPLYDFADNSAGNGRDFSATYNGIGEAIYNINRTKRHNVNANVNAIVDITEGLTFESTYGLNMYSSNFDRVRNSIQGSAGVALGGTLFKSNTTFTAQNFNQILRYTTNFGEGHNFNAFIAHETFESSLEDFDLNRKGVVNLNPNAVIVPENYIDQNGVSSGARIGRSLESYFTQANYNYANRYYLSATLRRDGSSRFYKNKWGTFGSLGAGWVVSEENFFGSSDVVDYLKLKVSYGVLGDQGTNSFAGQLGFNVENLLGLPSLAPRAVVDPNITWESSQNFQTGVEFKLFDGVINAGVDYYIKKTTDLYVNKRLSPSTGDAIILTNDGEMVNRGLEFDITANIVRNEDFNLSLSVNGEMFANEITQMPIENATGEAKVINIDRNFAQAEGRSRFDYYLREWAGVDVANGNPQWIEHWTDGNSNGQYDSGEGILDLEVYKAANPNEVIEERITNVYGNATRKFNDKSVIPTVRGAFRLNSSYKNFDLSTQFGYSLGGHGYDINYAILMSNGKVGASSYHVDMKNRWMNPGDVTDIPRLYSNENIRVNGSSTRFLTSSDYLSLNNIRLGYNIPSKYLSKIGLSAVNLWLSGDNLFILSARKGFNPTTSLTAGNEADDARYIYNPITNYTMGVRVKF